MLTFNDLSDIPEDYPNGIFSIFRNPVLIYKLDGYNFEDQSSSVWRTGHFYKSSGVTSISNSFSPQSSHQLWHKTMILVFKTLYFILHSPLVKDKVTGKMEGG